VNELGSKSALVTFAYIVRKATNQLSLVVLVLDFEVVTRPARAEPRPTGRVCRGSGGASPSYGVCQAAEQRVSGFSSFVEQRSCHFLG
jgi:hypothetical protein